MIKNSKGFTLMEMIIVIAIIVIIFAVSLVLARTFKGKGRDSERFADLRAIQGAIELYIQSNPKKLPPGVDQTTENNISGYAWTSNNPADQTLAKDLSPKFLNGNFPQDPLTSSGSYYIYCRNGHDYLLGAVLEKAGDIAGDIDTRFRLSGPYAIENTCISPQATPPPNSNLNCSDDPANGVINGVHGSVLCMGSGSNAVGSAIGPIQFMEIAP